MLAQEHIWWRPMYTFTAVDAWDKINLKDVDFPLIIMLELK